VLRTMPTHAMKLHEWGTQDMCFILCMGHPPNMDQKNQLNAAESLVNAFRMAVSVWAAKPRSRPFGSGTFNVYRSIPMASTPRAAAAFSAWREVIPFLRKPTVYSPALTLEISSNPPKYLFPPSINASRRLA